MLNLNQFIFSIFSKNISGNFCRALCSSSVVRSDVSQCEKRLKYSRALIGWTAITSSQKKQTEPGSERRKKPERNKIGKKCRNFGSRRGESSASSANVGTLIIK